MNYEEIPIALLDTASCVGSGSVVKPLLVSEISGVQVEHIGIHSEGAITQSLQDGVRVVYLFLKGGGDAIIADATYSVQQESILLPNNASQVVIKAGKTADLHVLKITIELSDQDLMELTALPEQNTQAVYYAKFSECQPYTEEIKSPNTVSRTILSNEYIPRVAMGTVLTKGPDEVAPHEHPMLEQLFLGLSKNNCRVLADDVEVSFPEHSVVHIPLGSRHSVCVDEGEVMYYVWMDFFLDKKGEEWLQTHKVDAS